MPEKKTVEKAKKDARQGKAPSTQAGEFVKEEFDHIREGKHGARSAKQAIAIGLSKARRAGVDLPSPPKGSPSAKSAKSAEKKRGQPKSAKRSKASENALKKEPRSSASKKAIGRQVHDSAQKRGSQKRHEAAEKAVRTKGKEELRAAGRKAARTRKAHGHHHAHSARA